MLEPYNYVAPGSSPQISPIVSPLPSINSSDRLELLLMCFLDFELSRNRSLSDAPEGPPRRQATLRTQRALRLELISKLVDCLETEKRRFSED